MKSTKNVRLGKTFVPKRYDLTLKPDLEHHTFEGREGIHFALAKPTKEIVLHAVDLTLVTASVTVGKKIIAATKILTDTKTETARFIFPTVIPKGAGVLHVVFVGELNDKMHGFYRSTYEVDGVVHTLATTQFESTDARRAFPCIDEPAAKAVFDVTLIVPKGHVAISNTLPIAEAAHSDTHTAVRFASSPVMSTYLLAFIVGKFEWLETKSQNGTLVRVFVTKGKKAQAAFALDVAVRALDFYEKYFGIRYPLKVLDNIAIPDFSAGAMENWGAITYRETALLVDESTSAAANKQRVALVIAHELAHQWFGNLVTMEWWTDLWLNEGFANYIEYLAIDALFPEWDVWTQFVQIDRNEALHLDSLDTTHAIEIPVHHPSEISEIFDTVSYAKGASIIRMLAEYVGAKTFRKGLQHYLKTHRYKNTVTADLWKSLEKVSKKPVRTIMGNWTKKSGYPLVTAAIRNNKLSLTQNRFYASQKSAKRSKDSTRWAVPLIIKNDTAKKDTRFLLTKSAGAVSHTTGTWLTINTNASGFFRTWYSSELLARYLAAIEQKHVVATERLALIDDLYALAESGHLSLVAALAATDSYTTEMDYSVWATLAPHLLTVVGLLDDQPYAGALAEHVRALLRPAATSVGWVENAHELHTQKMLRPLLLTTLALLDDPETLRAGATLWKKSFNGSVLPAGIRATVYLCAAKSGSARDHALLTKLYTDTDSQVEKARILQALCNFMQPDLIKKSLDFALSPAVRNQDTFMAFHTAWNNTKARDAVWEYTEKHWDLLVKRYDTGGHLLPRFVKPMSALHTIGDLARVKKFFKTHHAPHCARTMTQVVEKIETNSAYRTRDAKKVGQWVNTLPHQ